MTQYSILDQQGIAGDAPCQMQNLPGLGFDM